MAVIQCPACNKKISDKAKSCSHCNIALDSVDQEQLKSARLEQRINQASNLMTQSFVAMILFCGGFLFLYWQDAQPGTWQYITSISATVIGFFFYIITRVRLLLLKKSSK